MKEQEKIQLKREIKTQKMHPKNIQCSDKDREDKKKCEIEKKMF